MTSSALDRQRDMFERLSQVEKDEALAFSQDAKYYPSPGVLKALEDFGLSRTFESVVVSLD